MPRTTLGTSCRLACDAVRFLLMWHSARTTLNDATTHVVKGAQMENAAGRGQPQPHRMAQPSVLASRLSGLSVSPRHLLLRNLAYLCATAQIWRTICIHGPPNLRRDTCPCRFRKGAKIAAGRSIIIMDELLEHDIQPAAKLLHFKPDDLNQLLRLACR